ncbi:MAG: Rrf2 family transcriptional regulator [Planctomycetes bacterium]|nr:Rrf2 family transcriptional regulator [Planctomycetota bacterium]
MKFTAQAEYGLRCILSLARAELSASSKNAMAGLDKGSLSVPEIAEAEGLSVEYAGKLIRLLRDSGLVRSVIGRMGGYRLARRPNEISVAQVMGALEARIYEPQFCERYTGDRKFCVHTSDCALRSLWAGLQQIVDGVLSKVTLRELVGPEQAMAEWVQLHTPELQHLPPPCTRHGELGG